LSFKLLWLREARKLALAATSLITGTNFVARIATAFITTPESAEESLQADSRKVEQMTSRTATVVAEIATRVAVCRIVARTAVTFADFVARTTTSIVATPIRTEIFEQIPESEFRCTTTVIATVTTRITVCRNIARTAVTFADFVAWIACIGSKQMSQTFS